MSIFLNDPSQGFTLSLALNKMVGAFGQTPWSDFAAFSILFAAPVSSCSSSSRSTSSAGSRSAASRADQRADAAQRPSNQDRYANSTARVPTSIRPSNRASELSAAPAEVQESQHGHVIDVDDPEPAHPDEDTDNDLEDVQPDRQQGQPLKALGSPSGRGQTG